MAKYVSRRNPVSTRSLKRRPLGAVVVRHWNSSEVRFTRVNGGWLCSSTDSNWVMSDVVSSAAVAAECNSAVGCKESWARVY